MTLSNIGTKIALLIGVSAAPVLAFAQFDETGGLSDYLGDFITFINNTLIPLLFAIAFLVFVWGMYKYFIAGGDEPEEREKGQKLAIYAIVGFVLIISVFGIVNLLAGALNLESEGTTIDVPNTPGTSGSAGTPGAETMGGYGE